MSKIETKDVSDVIRERTGNSVNPRGRHPRFVFTVQARKLKISKYFDFVFVRFAPNEAAKIRIRKVACTLPDKFCLHYRELSIYFVIDWEGHRMKILWENDGGVVG